MKKVLVTIILAIFISNTLSQQALAQVETASSSANTQVQAEPKPFDSEAFELKKQAVVDSAIRSLAQSPQSSLSRTKRLPTKVRQLSKKTFKSEEKIPVIIENEDANSIQVEMFNANGEQLQVDVELITTSDPVTLTVAPARHFEPGRYRLKITDSTGAVSTQDFLWGVLAINTNKSIYQPTDTAKIQMAVLDELGNMVCDAKATLAIKDPLGKVITLSTPSASDSAGKNGIKVNPECFKKEYTAVPDYETSYSIEAGEGKYEMTLTAETKNGNYTITDSFETKIDVPFDVERNTNTRIYPPVRYPVSIDITANQDFSGEISEVVPESFNIGIMENTPFFTVATRSAQIKEQSLAHLDLPFNGIYEMTQGFGEEETDPLMAEKYHQYKLAGHDGIDYALPMGTPVLATADGIVVRAQEKGDYGTTIIVQHSWGKSYYGHLSKLEKKQGDIVKKGETLGLSGNTGLSTGPHLHFGIKLKGNDTDNGYYGKVNPKSYLKDASSLGEVAGVSTSDPKILRNDTGDGVQILTWNVDVKKGDKIKLGYTYLAPNDSPEFYTLGPLEFISSSPVIASGSASNSQIIFKEARTWQIAADAVANSGLFVYSDTTDLDDTNAKTYTDPTTLGSEYTTVNPAGTMLIANVKVVRSPTREEAVMAQQLRNGILNIYSCTTGCDAAGDWTHIATHSAVTTDANSELHRPWDIAYEQLSGLFTVVFYEAAPADTGDLHYCQWDGTNWTPATECNNGGARPAVFAPGAGNAISYSAIVGNTVAEWVRLVPKGERLTSTRSDEFLLGMSDAGDDLFLAYWDGSSWQDGSNSTDFLSTTNAQKFDLAWEETTGEGLVVFASASAAMLGYARHDGEYWLTRETSAEANNGGQAFSSWIHLANDPITDDIAIITADSGSDIELFYWNGSSIDDQDAVDDLTAEAVTGDMAQVQWTRFTSEAVYTYTDASVLTSDMSCWQTGGGNFTAVISDIGNPNISNVDDVEDANLVASPNNDRMLLTRRAIANAGNNDIEALTYDGAGCADADWASVGQLTNTSEGANLNSIMKVHSSAYTPYSPWSLNWRFYSDASSDDPATGWGGAAENAAATNVTPDTALRLRMNMSERGGIGQSDTRKILQYTTDNSGTCTPNTVENDTDCSWTDVGDTSETSAVWRYATTGESCGAECADNSTSNTPSLTGTTVGDPEVFYIADKNGAGDTAMDHTALTIKEIDFPLYSEAVASNTTYYFRLYEPRIGGSVGQDSIVFREQDDDGANDCASAACTYPSLTTSTFSAGPSLDQILRHGSWFSSGVEQPFTF